MSEVKTKNTLSDLNNHLFEALERLNDEDLVGEAMDREIARAEAISEVAQTIIKNADTVLKAAELACEYGQACEVPRMLLP